MNMLTVARKKEHLFKEDLVDASNRKLSLIYSYTAEITKIFVNYF